MAKIVTAVEAREELKQKNPTEVPDSVIFAFNDLVDKATTDGKNQIDQSNINNITALLNKEQKANFESMLTKAGFKFVHHPGDPMEHLSYDVEYWEF